MTRYDWGTGVEWGYAEPTYSLTRPVHAVISDGEEAHGHLLTLADAVAAADQIDAAADAAEAGAGPTRRRGVWRTSVPTDTLTLWTTDRQVAIEADGQTRLLHQTLTPEHAREMADALRSAAAEANRREKHYK